MFNSNPYVIGPLPQAIAVGVGRQAAQLSEFFTTAPEFITALQQYEAGVLRLLAQDIANDRDYLVEHSLWSVEAYRRAAADAAELAANAGWTTAGLLRLAEAMRDVA